MIDPSTSPAGPSLAGGNPGSAPAAVAHRAGGSTHSEVLPPSSPRQSLGVDDGATSVPSSADHAPRGAGQRPPAGSPFPLGYMRGWR